MAIMPFIKSPIKVNIAGKKPKLRSIFENPALLLPKLLISFFWLKFFEIIIEKLKLPIRYDIIIAIAK